MLLPAADIICRCSGCTQEFNLHRPTILDEATDFFKKHGVSDFSFDSCKLVRPRLFSCSFRYFIIYYVQFKSGPDLGSCAVVFSHFI